MTRPFSTRSPSFSITGRIMLFSRPSSLTTLISFPDLEAIRDSFRRFVGLIPEDGALVACVDDPEVASIAARAACPVLSYGQGSDCVYQLDGLRPQGLATEFTVRKQGRELGRFTMPLPGLHNALNATAVIGLMDHLGFTPEEIASGVASFEGVKRRQQVRGEVNGIMVIDDFAHHPTAVRETIRALRLAWPEKRLVVVFEPRTNSSRRSIFQHEYATAFDGADLVVVREHVPLADVPAEEQFSSARLVQDLRDRGLRAEYFPDTDAILDFLGQEAQPGDCIAILSNGGFDNIHTRLLDRLRQ